MKKASIILPTIFLLVVVVVIRFVPRTSWSPDGRLVLIAVVGFVLLIAYIRILLSYRNKKKVEAELKEMEYIRNRCPKCLKPWAKIEDRSECLGKERETQLKTVHETDSTYNDKGILLETTKRTKQIPIVRYTYTYRYFYHCKYCGYEWNEELWITK